MTYDFLSVAEHSVNVADRVADLGGDEHMQFCGLMHDAHEAYISDFIQPMKDMEEMGCAYKRLEARWEMIMHQKFFIDMGDGGRRMVHQADMDVTATEMRDFTRYPARVWDRVGNVIDTVRTTTLDPIAARSVFLKRFEQLEGRV